MLKCQKVNKKVFFFQGPRVNPGRFDQPCDLEYSTRHIIPGVRVAFLPNLGLSCSLVHKFGGKPGNEAGHLVLRLEAQTVEACMGTATYIQKAWP